MATPAVLPVADVAQGLDLSTLTPSQRIKLSFELPELFAKTYLQTNLWYMQKEILNSLTVPQARVAVKACHASSKTFTAALAVLWFLAKYQEVVVVTTAPTWGQVERLLWGEVHSFLAKSTYPFPIANLTKIQFPGGAKRLAYGLATSVTKSDEGVKFQGIHAEHVLIILDEAPGVEAKIWEAIEGARAGGNVRILAIGNPTISSGPFHDAFTDNRSGWKTYTISAFDTPNLKGTYFLDQLGESKRLGKKVPGDLLEATDEELDINTLPYLTTRRWVQEKYYEWGPGHPLWESRVLGNFPKQSPDALMSLTWLEEAGASQGIGVGKIKAGLDVAGPGEDESSLTVRRGGEIILHKQWNYSDPRGDIVICLRNLQERLKENIENINIDSIGIGWGICQHLKDMGFPVTPINVCEISNDGDKYFNLKAEFYWGLRLRFQAGEISGLSDEKTVGQLAGIRYKPTSKGQIQIESKEDAAKRGMRSPDRAESIMLAFAERTLVYGALDFFKDMRKLEEAKSLLKPMQVDKPLNCPSCQATCICRAQGEWRCGQCGLQFRAEREVQPIGLRTQSRTDVLQKMDRKIGFMD
jgi:phage terminase large subunit